MGAASTAAFEKKTEESCRKLIQTKEMGVRKRK